MSNQIEVMDVDKTSNHAVMHSVMVMEQWGNGVMVKLMMKPFGLSVVVMQYVKRWKVCLSWGGC